MGVGDEDDVDVVLALELRGGDDDLERLGVVRVGDRVVEEADGPRDLARQRALVVLLEVGRVAEDEGGLGDLRVALDAPGLAVGVEEDLVDGPVEHEGAAVDGAEAGEALGQAAEAVHGVDVGRLAVAVERVDVEVDRHDRRQRRLLEVAVVDVEGHGVADELLRQLLEAEVVVELLHRHDRQVLALVRLDLVLVVALEVDEELAEPPLLEEAQERRAQRLAPRRGHLVDLAAPVDVGRVQALELEVARDLGVEQHLHELPARHDALGDEVDVVVPVLAQDLEEAVLGLLPVVELGEEVRQVQRRAVRAVVLVPVDVEDLRWPRGVPTRRDAKTQRKERRRGTAPSSPSSTGGRT